IVALAHGYLAAYDEPIPTDPGSVGGRLPTDLMDLWQNGKDGMTEAEPLGEGNEKTVAAIMIAAKRLGLVPSACSFSNELRDWVTPAGYVPTTVGVVVAGDTYRLVTGPQGAVWQWCGRWAVPAPPPGEGHGEDGRGGDRGPRHRPSGREGRPRGTRPRPGRGPVR